MHIYEAKRQELVNLVLTNMMKNSTGKRSVHKAAKDNLALTNEERILRTVYRSSTRQ